MNIYIEFIKMLFALLVVLGILYLLTRYFKHRVMSTGGLINIVQYQPLSTKGGIAVVKIGDEYFAIGISEAGVTLITKVESSKVELYLTTKQQNVRQFSIKNLFRREG